MVVICYTKTVMLKQSFRDFILSTNTDGGGKAASYVRVLDMLGPILTRYRTKNFCSAAALRACHISPWAVDDYAKEFLDQTGYGCEDPIVLAC